MYMDTPLPFSSLLSQYPFFPKPQILHQHCETLLQSLIWFWHNQFSTAKQQKGKNHTKPNTLQITSHQETSRNISIVELESIRIGIEGFREKKENAGGRSGIFPRLANEEWWWGVEKTLLVWWSSRQESNGKMSWSAHERDPWNDIDKGGKEKRSLGLGPYKTFSHGHV